MNGLYGIGDVVFTNWTLTRLIGEGSFGRVFEAQREDHGTVYSTAVKIITIPQSEAEVESVRYEGMSDVDITGYFRGFVEEIVQEVKLMSKLEGSSNVVGYRDHTTIQHSEGVGWDILIRMELLTPLLAHCAEQGLSRQSVIKLGIDICKALEHCQIFSIIHRDIKPENIFVSELGDYKLGDFGIARTVEKTSSGLTKIGTQTYIAPEVSRGEDYGPGVDIYSLGIVLFRMLNDNRTPFLPEYPAPITHSDRETALAKRFSGVAIPAPKNADQRLAEIVLKACAHDPLARYPSPKLMREDLEAAIHGDAGKPVAYNTAPDVYANPYGQAYSDPNMAYSHPQYGQDQFSQTQHAYAQYAQEQYAQPQHTQPHHAYVNHGQFPHGQATGQKTGKSKSPLIAVLASIVVVIIAAVLIIAFTGGKDDAPTPAPSRSPRPSEPAETSPGTSPETSPDTSPAVTAGTQSVQMPDLVGQHYVQARNVLDAIALELIIIEDPINSEIERGYVIMTIPEAGSDLLGRNRVTIIYSAGPAVVEETVPELIGSTKEQVESAFRVLGITPIFSYFEHDSPEGVVTYIERAGQKVVVPTSINVHISLGLPQIVPPPSPAETDYILPFSSVRALTDADLRGLSKTELRLARNEIFARHGRQFNDQELQAYFNSKSWYAVISKLPLGVEPSLSTLEMSNVMMIRDYEAR